MLLCHVLNMLLRTTAAAAAAAAAAATTTTTTTTTTTNTTTTTTSTLKYSILTNICLYSGRTATVESCPSDVTVLSTSQLREMAVEWEAPVFLETDNSSLEVACSHDSGSVFRSGVTRVVCYPVDYPGIQCNFSISVTGMVKALFGKCQVRLYLYLLLSREVKIHVLYTSMQYI